MTSARFAPKVACKLADERRCARSFLIADQQRRDAELEQRLRRGRPAAAGA